MLGNIEIRLRRSIENELLAAYRTALIKAGVDEKECPPEWLRDEYRFGGAAKWCWLLPLMFIFTPDPTQMQWFIDQVRNKETVKKRILFPMLFRFFFVVL